MTFFNSILFFTVFILTTITLKEIKPLLIKYFLDEPNKRSSHVLPTPKAGGIVFALYSSISGYLLGTYIFLSCLPIAILGLFDDLYNLKPLIRFLAQLIISGFIVNQSIYKYQIESNIGFYFAFLIFTVLSTAYINLTNFMDGLDGLVSGCLLVTLSSFMFYTDINLVPIIGSLLGFLIFNWYPAKLFMGDTGSTFLGLLLFHCTFSSGNIEFFIAFALINTPIFGDASLCILRRYFNGQKIFSAHKLHLYQRLYASGWSKSKVSTLYIFLTLILSSIYYLLGFTYLLLGCFMTIALGLYLDKNHSLPFNLKT